MKLSMNDFSSVVTALKLPEDKAADGEIRSSTRINVWSRIDAWFADGKRAYTAMMRDISLDGAGLLQSVMMNEGQSVLLMLPRPKTPLAIYSHVVHCRTLADGVMVVGMQYDKLAGDEITQQLSQARVKEQARIQKSILQ
jgi:hypothetical protein